MDGAVARRAPAQGALFERALVRVGVRDHVARLLSATPSLRMSWIAAAAVAVGFAAWAARAGPRGLLLFLVLAPLLPVAGVAAAYGPWMDPMYEMSRATPGSGLRLLLLRSAAVLGLTAALVALGAAVLPSEGWLAAAWILPSLALALASLALSTFMPAHWAAGIVALSWIAVSLATVVRAPRPFLVFRGPGQLGFFCLAVGSSVILAWRRERLQIEGRAEQRRLIDAAESERRRIERDIHDGAQQQLVSISVRLGLAKAEVSRNPHGAVAMIEEVRAEIVEALEELRELTRGAYPPILADRGLVAALEQKGRGAPFPVTVSGDGIGRHPQDVESAVYFCCLEALQNCSKYARASEATIRLRLVGSELSFSVVDDGVGFEPDLVRRGLGLRSMQERVEALGGALEIRSSPGEGATISGRIPC